MSRMTDSRRSVSKDVSEVVISLMDAAGVSTEELAERTGVPVHQLNSRLQNSAMWDMRLLDSVITALGGDLNAALQDVIASLADEGDDE